MKLFHRTTDLGEVVDSSPDGFWMYGTFKPNHAAAAYKEVFEFFVDEGRAGEEPPFATELLTGWLIEEGGIRRATEMPAVHVDGAIAWRWM